MIRQALPAKRKAPVKVAPIVVLAIWRWFHELKSIQINSGYIRGDDCSGVLSYSGQQRFQPAVEAFTWKDKDI